METKRKFKKKRRWSSADDELLLEVWERRIADLRGVRKNNHVYQEMGMELSNIRGSAFTAEEIRIKINNLTCRYRKEKHKNVSGIPSDWPPFQKIHTILGGFNASKEEFLIDDTFTEAISYGSECKQEEEEETSRPETPFTPSISDMASPAEAPAKRPRGKPAKKKRPATVFDSLLKEYRQTNLTIIEERNHVRKVDLEMLEIERERNEILKEFVSNAQVFQENVTRMLQKIK